MNQQLYTIMYGKQNQSVKMNGTTVDFIEEYLTQSGYAEMTADNIKECLTQVVNAAYTDDKLGMLDYFFIELFLGNLETDAGMLPLWKYDIRYQVRESGKAVFYISGVTDSVVEKLPTTEQDKSLNELTQKIISTCPPSRRDELPEDDMLAAVYMSRDYWKGQFK